MGRYLEQGRVLHGALCLRMEDLHRCFPLMELILEELVVFLVLDLRLVARPERLHGVQRARLDLLDLLRALDLLAILVFRRLLELEVHLDRVAHIVRILLDEALDLVVVREIIIGIAAVEAFLQLDRDGRAAALALALLDRIAAITGRLPARSLLLAGLARLDGHLFADHECRVETDTELTDELLVIDRGIILLRLLQLLEECLRAGLRNRADVVYDFLTAHADAVILDCQRMSILVRYQVDLECLIIAQDIGIGQALEMDLVDRIRCVRDELPQEDLVIRIDGVDHQVQQLLGFGLEFMFLFGHNLCYLSSWYIFALSLALISCEC